MFYERLEYLNRPPRIVQFLESANYYTEKIVHELIDARREDGVLRYSVTFTKVNKETGEPLTQTSSWNPTLITVSETDMEQASGWIANATTAQCGKSITVGPFRGLGLNTIALRFCEIQLDAAQATRPVA